MRIGHGYDVHRLVPGRKLILGGVDIPHHLGLLGHSDADVAAHALADALLGAAALGDIGQHFPDTDPAYAGADSLVLLAKVVELLKAEGSFTSSEFVRRITGVESVCERSAVTAAGPEPELIIKKQVRDRVTVAAAASKEKLRFE